MAVLHLRTGRFVDPERDKFDHVSMFPPRHDPPPADALRPGSCIIETRTYFSNRTNSTTASCKARDGSLLRVTFFIAPPPRISYLCVCCPTKSPYEQFASEPLIVAAEDDLVLIRMVFGNHANREDLRKYDFFVYRAGSADRCRAPSLTRILPPKPFVFPGKYRVALLPRYVEDPHLYYIVILHKTTAPPHRKFIEEDLRFDIHIYNSKTASWIRKPTSLVKHYNRNMWSFKSSKVITIGGASGGVAWVDLRYGFLQCHVLKDTAPMLHYIPLPKCFDQKFDAGYSDACIKRDIALIQGRIKFLHLQNKVFPEVRPFRNQGWTVATYSRTAVNPWEVGWQQDGNPIEVDAKSLAANPMLFQHLPPKLLPEDSSAKPKPLPPKLLPVDSSATPKPLPPKLLPEDSSATPKPLPPKLLPEESSATPKPLPPKLLVCSLSCPLLSLHQDDHVYVMANVVSGRCDGPDWDSDHREGDALGLTFDLNTGKLEKVVQVNAERAFWGVLFFFMLTRISKYLDMDTGSRGKGKRQGKGKVGQGSASSSMRSMSAGAKGKSGMDRQAAA